MWVSLCDKLSLMLEINLNVFSPQTWDSRIMQAGKEQMCTYLLEPSQSNNNLCEPREYSRLQVTGMIEWGQKSKPKKSVNQKLTPKMFYVMWCVKC